MTNWLANSEPSGVVEDGLELRSAGGGVDLVVDGEQRAAGDLVRVGAVVGFDDELPAALHRLLHLRKLIFRQREDDGDGMDLRDDDEAGGVRGVDDVAGIDETQTDDAVDGRVDLGVAEVDARGFDGGLIGLDGAGGLTLVGDLELLLLLGDDAGFIERGVALGLSLHVLEVGLVLGESADGLVERGLVGTRIDLEEELALPDGLAFAEVHLQELAVDARVQRNGVVRGDGAERGEEDGNGLLLNGSDLNRRGTVGGRGLLRGQLQQPPDCWSECARR